jgi:hypothetical protein
MIIIRCRHCQARVQIPSPGTYRCHNCKQIIEVNEESYPEIFRKLKSTTETAELADVDSIDSNNKEQDTSLSYYGAKCKRHPHNHATRSCARCGDLMCDSCAIRLENRYYCSDCIARIQSKVAVLSEEEQRSTRAEKSSIPLENYKKEGYFKTFFLTVWIGLYKFYELFDKSGRRAKIGTALAYGVIMNCIYEIVRFAAVNFFKYKSLELPKDAPPLIKEIYSTYADVKLTYFLTAPLRALLGIILLALIYHIGVMIVGGAGKYETTLKITCYSMSSLAFTIVLFPVPLLPWILALVFGILIVIQGSIQYHKIPEGKAIFVAFFPYIIILFLAVLVGLIFFITG